MPRRRRQRPWLAWWAGDVPLPENGFCVLRLKARGQRELVTVVGHAAMISAGEFVQMSGSWVNDRTHGQQFRATFLRTSPPTTLEGIERCLASRG